MRNLLVLFGLILMAISCQTAKDEFSIKGTIEGIETGKIYLQRLVEGQPQNIDTADVVDGKFTFKGKMEMPDFRLLVLNEQDYFAPFFLDNSSITVKAKKDSLRAATYKGSPSQDIFKIYMTEVEKLSKDMQALQTKFQNAMSTGNTDEAEKAKIDGQAMQDNNLFYTKNFVKEHKNSVVSAYFALAVLAGQVNGAELDSIVSSFPAEIGTSEYVIKLKEIVQEQKKTAVGVEAPDFTMNDQEDKPITLSSLRGKIVLIDFWASWCAPCRQENPNVVKLYNQYHDKGFEILGVSLDKDKESWMKAIKDDQLSWLHVSDLQYWQNAVARLYGVNSIPQTYLLDKEGKIIAKGLRSEQLAAKLGELFPN